MKNFKKVLALVLVLATLMGFATVAGAAYKDADQIDADYSEAIQVLELIETMEGYPDGTFGPKKTITREEAAKLIAIFDNKDSDISTYYTSINPFADEKGRWGESYVGYGYRAGIIAGMNATTYAPTANVTGTQFLKMALVTLGYDQEAEGFVGSSWAVNVLALARKLDLIDGLADGWKAENDLTREEAAQILLNTLKADTVEYAQEAKQVGFKAVPDGKNYTWQGRIYLTVAGAVSTGKKLYKDFDLETSTSYDAFMRPYVKWTLGKDSVEVMEAPKATFTKEFTACDLLVELGVDKKDQDTQIVIDYVYNNGVQAKYKPAMTDPLYNGNGTGYKLDETYTLRPADGDHGKDTKEIYGDAYGIWSHENSNCVPATSAKHGAQGTLTQVFYNGKDSEGNKHYYVTSIETWLGKVSKVSSKTTARDDHLKGENAVKIEAFLADEQTNHYNGLYNRANSRDITLGSYCNSNTGADSLLREVENRTYVTKEEKTVDGDTVTTYFVSYDDPAGLAEKDYVLFTYSFKQNKGKDEGVQSVDVVEGKEGRLTGYKMGTVASFPTETRIGEEFVKDSVHFHLGYDDSKKNNYGLHTFFYDAYGNVIGLDDSADTSDWGVVNGAYITYPKGTGVLNVEIVGLEGGEPTEGTAKEFLGVKKFDGVTAADILAEILLNGNVKKDGESRVAFTPAYDHLFKISKNSNGEYTVAQAETGKVHSFFGVDSYGDLNWGEIKVEKQKPGVTATYSGNTEKLTMTSETKILVHKMDGSYVGYTGYKNIDSMIAHAGEYVLDDDGFVSVLYLCADVYMTSDKITGYVGHGADVENYEVKEDSDPYYGLYIYVKGEKTKVYVDDYTMHRYFDETNESTNVFVPGFYQLQYVTIDEVPVVRVLKAAEDKLFDDYLNEPIVLDKYNGTVVELTNNSKKESYAVADDCALYAIYKGDVYESDVQEIKDNYETIDGNYGKVYLELNDDDQVVAIYILIAPSK